MNEKTYEQRWLKAQSDARLFQGTLERIAGYPKHWTQDTSETCDRMRQLAREALWERGYDALGNIIASNQATAVEIKADGRCDCHAGNFCPIGRRGSLERCTVQELQSAGIKTFINAVAGGDPVQESKVSIVQYKGGPCAGLQELFRCKLCLHQALVPPHTRMSGVNSTGYYTVTEMVPYDIDPEQMKATAEWIQHAKR